MDVCDCHILSVGTALPGPRVSNAELAVRLGLDTLWEQWVGAFIGTHGRHLAVDLETGEPSHRLADLCETAARTALDAAGVRPLDVDVVVMGTATPDQLMPATVNVVADRLSIDGVPTYQLQSGCTGALQALDVARQMLLTGQRSTALVLGGELCTRVFGLGIDFAALPPSEMVNVAIFGDGAGAVVLTTQPRAGSVAIRRLVTRLTGLNRPPGQVLEWFAKDDRGSARPAASEDYKAIEESVPSMTAEILDELLEDLDWKVTDLSYLLPPQLSGRMTEKIMARLATTEPREISCVQETGNTGNALPFLQLERALPEMKTGDRAVAIAIESSKWIKAGLALERI